MNSIGSPSSNRFTLAYVVMASGILFGGYYLWYRSYVAAQFRAAMERKDYARAERLWSRGVPARPTDPHAQFMRIRDRLKTVNGVRITVSELRENVPLITR
jgi:hypothetical protein